MAIAKRIVPDIPNAPRNSHLLDAAAAETGASDGLKPGAGLENDLVQPTAGVKGGVPELSDCAWND